MDWPNISLGLWFRLYIFRRNAREVMLGPSHCTISRGAWHQMPWKWWTELGSIFVSYSYPPVFSSHWFLLHLLAVFTVLFKKKKFSHHTNLFIIYFFILIEMCIFILFNCLIVLFSIVFVRYLLYHNAGKGLKCFHILNMGKKTTTFSRKRNSAIARASSLPHAPQKA